MSCYIKGDWFCFHSVHWHVNLRGKIKTIAEIISLKSVWLSLNLGDWLKLPGVCYVFSWLLNMFVCCFFFFFGDPYNSLVMWPSENNLVLILHIVIPHICLSIFFIAEALKVNMYLFSLLLPCAKGSWLFGKAIVMATSCALKTEF